MFGWIFKKKPLKCLGRSGLVYTYEGEKYFVDSEFLFGDYNIVIYQASICLEKDRNAILGDALKNEVFTSLLEYLKNKERLKVDVA